MSYFRRIKLEDDEGNVVDSYDIRNLGLKQLLFLVYIELKKISAHMYSITDEEINYKDLD